MDLILTNTESYQEAWEAAKWPTFLLWTRRWQRISGPCSWGRSYQETVVSLNYPRALCPMHRETNPLLPTATAPAVYHEDLVKKKIFQGKMERLEWEFDMQERGNCIANFSWVTAVFMAVFTLLNYPQGQFKMACLLLHTIFLSKYLKFNWCPVPRGKW